ncbi:hypothetical protein CCHL11_10196 [Colletotrichum chlorophyti]|uniref:Rhodopsin domain-containing protein n=1 Tax=Colletotrichum chlorophyti TaxID=708187 RepID=A0A1Q8RXN6_9PEZI|nr:hypothetical protein CCHL11_10196 [Colletotrichum chlorophyti]
MALAAVQCLPVSYNWNGWKGDFGPVRCFNLNIFSWSMSAVSIALDMTILVMPLPLVVKLKTTPRRKFAIVFMFSLGILVVIASCLRLRFNILYGDSVNITWDYVDLMIWTGVEVATSIAITSLPSIRLLLHRRFPGFFGRIFAFGGHVDQDREQYLEVCNAPTLDVEGMDLNGITRRGRKSRFENTQPPTIGGGSPRERSQRVRRPGAPNEALSLSKKPVPTEASRVLASIMGSLSGSRTYGLESTGESDTVTTDITTSPGGKPPEEFDSQHDQSALDGWSSNTSTLDLAETPGRKEDHG